jgi:hypothetical protein
MTQTTHRDTARNSNKATGLAGHPQLRKITEAVLKGDSVRQIAAWTRPAVSFATIARYARDTVKPTLERAEELAPIAPEVIRSGISDLQASVTRDDTVTQNTTQACVGAVALSVRGNRLAALQERHERLLTIVQERAERYEGKTPGGGSGYLAKDYKGKDADRPVYKIDGTLLGELRELEKQIAIESGQWQESAAPNVAIQIVLPTMATSGQVIDVPTVNIALPARK